MCEQSLTNTQDTYISDNQLSPYTHINTIPRCHIVDSFHYLDPTEHPTTATNHS